VILMAESLSQQVTRLMKKPEHIRNIAISVTTNDRLKKITPRPLKRT